MLKLLSRIFPSKSEKDVNRILPIVAEINRYVEEFSALSDDELRGKTAEFRQRIKEAIQEYEGNISSLREKLKAEINLSLEERENMYIEIEEIKTTVDQTVREVLDEILPEAYAVVKEACRRLVGQTWEVTEHKVVWDMVPFDVQLIGAVVLHEGKIAEMATGEGKTLVATMPLYLNALPGRGVHLVTVNDYLALRDSQWMGKVFEFLGLTIGCIQTQMDSAQRRKQYGCDITYGTNNEFGFDYLRDNMVISPEDLVHREYYYAIVDEVDSVLIDEARTPLIISGPVKSEDQKFAEMKPRVDRLVNAQRNFVTKITAEAEQLLAQGKEEDAGVQILRAYRGLPKHNRLMKLLSEPANKKLMQHTEMEYLRDQSRRMHEIDDELFYAIDEKDHSINLSEKGRDLLAGSANDKDFFVLPDVGTEIAIIENDPSLSPEQKQQKKDELNLNYAEKSDRIHTVTQLLRAYSLYEKDDEYVVSDDGKVMIVDEFTGRLLPGRRYSDGLHQAIEAKEGVKVERDMQTLATITLQNYFRLYKKLAGMTGTAETEASEFFEIYKLDVVVIPTNKEMIRDDSDDVIYKTKREKYNAVIQEIEELRKVNRPVLVGTTSVEVSETLSRMLKRQGIPHNVLNAKQHQREAEIVAHAGLPGSVTIATNMAGRGTDIKLGPGVAQAGGLHIVGTERHESRRIDRQLRGRAGRQGDPGSSKFYLSLEDDLMRLFGSDRIAGIMERLGLKEGDVIQHPMITRSVQRAQKKVEENNFAIRKRLLEYDNVMNQQREVIYSRRRHALLGDRLREDILEMVYDYIDKLVDTYYEHGEIDQLKESLRTNFLIDFTIDPQTWQTVGKDGVKSAVFKTATEFYKRKEERIGAENLAALEKMVSLQVIDEKWKDHLREMDDLKEGIHLRAYGQKDPILEYKSESFNMFVELLDMISTETLNLVFKLFPQQMAEVPARRQPRLTRPQQMTLTHASAQGLGFQGNREPVSGGEDAERRGGPPEAKAGKPQPIHVGEKTGRNDPCPCGSGKKYKNCHGR
ncbi:MAG: preprotein translocase subunit SecA [Burkholderiales bacterium]|nr:preprotein translocase subunit SecA [Ignavibacteria bacterium]MBI3713857.1 preprotein translocase subunit SecA [Burkholderiales bacterium]